MKRECHGCGQSFDDQHDNVGHVGIKYCTKHQETSSDEAYCPRCTLQIEDLVHNDAIFEQLQALVKVAIAKKQPTTTVSISESLVREIAKNLGASYKLADALVERIFGPNWNGAPPENSGLVMNKYANRDRLVAFVAGMLKDLWTLEAR